jgi:hypothetical protein
MQTSNENLAIDFKENLTSTASRNFKSSFHKEQSFNNASKSADWRKALSVKALHGSCDAGSSDTEKFPAADHKKSFRRTLKRN